MKIGQEHMSPFPTTFTREYTGVPPDALCIFKYIFKYVDSHHLKANLKTQKLATVFFYFGSAVGNCCR
jgi:hypothetical protein